MTMMVAAIATAYMPAPAAMPMAAATHRPAAVVSPRTARFWKMMQPAPMKPMPETTWAAMRENHKQATTQSDEEVGAETCLLGAVFAFESDGAAKQSGNENAKNKICCHRQFVIFLCKDTK